MNNTFTKATVTYKEDGQTKTISVEAADPETVRDAVAQWKRNEKRLSNRTIEILTIQF
jgi:hypothetical protein